MRTKCRARSQTQPRDDRMNPPLSRLAIGCRTILHVAPRAEEQRLDAPARLDMRTKVRCPSASGGTTGTDDGLPSKLTTLGDLMHPHPACAARAQPAVQHRQFIGPRASTGLRHRPRPTQKNIPPRSRLPAGMAPDRTHGRCVAWRDASVQDISDAESTVLMFKGYKKEKKSLRPGGPA